MPLLNAAIDVLNQLKYTIENTESIYTESLYSNSQQGSPIGKHVRHILDHFEVLVAGAQQGEINYNLRSRDSEAERNPKAALERIDHIQQSISNFPDTNQPIQVETEIALTETVSRQLHSSLGREVAYVTSHGIHHLAYIKLIAQCQQIELDGMLGVAPATASHIRSQ